MTLGAAYRSTVSSRRVLFLWGLGIAAMQLTWLLGVPPFAASDEFDHAYRAAGIADGQWLLQERAVAGRGLEVRVSADLVDAAQAQCASLPYTGAANCGIGSGTGGAGGQVTVATAAGPYNPLYYTVVAVAYRMTDGATALLVARAISSAVCLAVILTGVATLRSVGGVWTTASGVIAMTPTLMFSISMLSPNGLEMAVGFLLWCLLLRLQRQHREMLPKRVLPLAAVAAVVLVNVRMLGPMWFVLIVATVAAFGGRTALRRVWAEHRAGLTAAGAIVCIGVTISGVWIIAAGATASSDAHAAPQDLWRVMFKQWVVWVLQIIGAFPYRDSLAPLWVYPAVGILFVALLVIAVRRARNCQRLAISLAAATAVFLPFLLTLATAETQGVIWQGRYILPFVVGLPLMLGLVLDDVEWAPREGRRLRGIALALLGLAHASCLYKVVEVELSQRASATDPAWVLRSPLLAAFTALVGFALVAIAANARANDARE